MMILRIPFRDDELKVAAVVIVALISLSVAA
jgi:hypothetical protein